MDDLTIERIAVDTKDLRGLGLISMRFGQRSLDESLFEFIESFIQKNPAVDHLFDKVFQRLFHDLLPWEDGLFFSPPTLQRAVANQKLRFHFIGSHDGDNSGPGQEIRYQLRVLQPLRLHVERR